MNKLDALVVGREDHSVVSGNGAATQGGKTDGTGRPRACMSIAIA